MLYPVNIASFSNQSLVKPNFKASIPVKSENIPANGGAVYSTIVRNYAVTSPNFTISSLRDKNIELELTDEPTDPVISITLDNYDKIPSKPGMRMLHKIVLNDIMVDVLSGMTNIDSTKSYTEPSSIRFDLKSPESEFYYTNLVLTERFLKFDFDEYFFRNAKKIIPVGYFLNQKAGYYEGFFDDIPKGTSEEDYAKIIDAITLDDLKQYHNNLLQNSDLNVKLKMNKDFYKQNKNDVDKSLKLIDEKAGE